LAALFGFLADGLDVLHRLWPAAQLTPTSTPSLPAFEIVNANSGKCLDVAQGSGADNANVQQFTCNGAGSQKWLLRAGAGESYEIVNVNSGKCLDVAQGSTADNANVQQLACHGASNQKWRFELYEETADGTSYVVISVNSDKCLDVLMDSTEDNANVQQYTCHRGPNQRWYGFKF
jgi:hypothetical protein